MYANTNMRTKLTLNHVLIMSDQTSLRPSYFYSDGGFVFLVWQEAMGDDGKAREASIAKIADYFRKDGKGRVDRQWGKEEHCSFP